MSTPPDLTVIWQEMLKQSDVCCDVLIQGVFATGISDHRNFQGALAALLGTKLADRALSAPVLSALVTSALIESPEIAEAAAEDMIAIFERDAACPDYVTPFLFFKGYHAIQAYRIAHWLWQHDRQHLARHIQSLVSERFGLDIHPAAQLGRRLVFDHGAGIIIGETCIIEDDVSLLQGVTLGAPARKPAIVTPRCVAVFWWVPVPLFSAILSSGKAQRSAQVQWCWKASTPTPLSSAIRPAASARATPACPPWRWISACPRWIT